MKGTIHELSKTIAAVDDLITSSMIPLSQVDKMRIACELGLIYPAEYNVYATLYRLELVERR